ncbi:hypothetical protein ACWIGM_08750 [Bosea sp. NPDC055332]
MSGILFLVAFLTVIVAVVADLINNPYLIEERIFGSPPRKAFFIYRRGLPLTSEAHFYSRDEADDWIAKAKAIQS